MIRILLKIIRGGGNMKRRKSAGGSSSKKGKAQDDSPHYGRGDDAEEPRQKFLNKDKITKEALEGPAFELLQKRFKNSVDLEYNWEQCHLALTNKIDWANPEGHRSHADLSKPLPLVGPPGRKTIPISYFFNRDYLKYGNVEKKYDLSVTKIKAARYEQEGIEEMILVQSIKVNKKCGYAYLEEIVVKRIGEKEYMFAEADFLHLNQNDIEDLFLLKIQNMIHNINGVNEFDLINALQLYIRRIVIRKRVEEV
ncbi:hypothetical protein Tco_0980249 [Tanacetum coccineum]